MKILKTLVFLCLFVAVPLVPAVSQDAQPARRNFVVPQSGIMASRSTPRAELTLVEAGVVIVEQTATTTLDITLTNPHDFDIETSILLPVPDNAVFKAFTFEGSAKEPVAELLRKKEANAVYRDIVARLKDPALLEFAGYSLIRSSVFPVPANGKQKLRMTYESVLDSTGDRVDYILPRTESLQYKTPWTVTVQINSKRNISALYSPSHELETKRVSANRVSVKMTKTAQTVSGSFMLSFLLEKSGVSATLMAYPEADGGYFMLLAGLPADRKKLGKTVNREVFIVIDRSGSMMGEKIKQAKSAALQVVNALEFGESFNIIIYNESVDMFATKPQVKDKNTLEKAWHYINNIEANGGTNIHQALMTTLSQKPTEKALPIVLFLTDGLPTAGNTSESAIVDVAKDNNPYKRRIFSFGVGYDVNTPLLERIAMKSRGASTFIQPDESVETKVADLFAKLRGPVFTDLLMTVTNSDAKEISAVRDVIPSVLPDLFDGEKLLLVGRYMGDKPLEFRLSGNYLGEKKEFEFKFDLTSASTKNSFVRRLWASRKIALLVDAVRDLGVDGPAYDPATNSRNLQPETSKLDTKKQAKLEELTNEIVRLSIKHGILTEYTAFLAKEGTDLSKRDDVMRMAQRNFVERAINTRSGMSSFNQSANNDIQRNQSNLNRSNSYLDEKMRKVDITNVQQVCDRAFFKRKGVWVDSRILENKDIVADLTVTLGSDEYFKLMEKLNASNRQAILALKGEILVSIDGTIVRIKPGE